MKIIARVEGDTFVARYVRLLRGGRRLTLPARPRLPLRALLTVEMPGLPAPTHDAIAAWLDHAYREKNTEGLRPQTYRPTVLGDFLDAVNAEEHLGAVREWNADAITAFARDKGGDVLAEIRGELEGAAQPATVAARARRLAQVIGIADAPVVLAELAALHDVEHLMGLEHAVARWIAAATEPRESELDQLARALPDDTVSAGISDVWFHWWWRLARACTRGDLADIVDRALALADDTCATGRKQPIAGAARAEAQRLSDRMYAATHARLWSEPPHRGATVAAIARDEDDAHYAAFMALSHAAHAIAHAHGGHLDASDANRQAMQEVAALAIETLRGP